MIRFQSRRCLAQHVQYIYPNVTLKYLKSSKILIALVQKSRLTFPIFCSTNYSINAGETGLWESVFYCSLSG